MGTFSNTFKTQILIPITIPGNGSNAATIAALLLAAGYSGTVASWSIHSALAGTGGSGADRPAIYIATPRSAAVALVAGDLSAAAQYVASGVAYSPGIEDTASTYVQSATSGTIAALAVVRA